MMGSPVTGPVNSPSSKGFALGLGLSASAAWRRSLEGAVELGII